MSLPKFLLRAFKPLTFTLIVILVVISFRQYQNSQQLAKEQSQSNVKTASALVWSQIETTFAKVDLLQEQANTPIFSSLAHQTLANTYLYKSIAQYDQRTQSYVDTRGEIAPMPSLDEPPKACNRLSYRGVIKYMRIRNKKNRVSSTHTAISVQLGDTPDYV